MQFTPPRISDTTVSASINYADDQLLPMTIGSTVHRIKTITITREVDGKTIPTTVEYKDKTGTTQKTITSRYVPPPNVTANNVQQSLEGGPRFAEAEAEGGRTLHIRGEEKDGKGNILRTFTATERTRGGTTTLQTTYRRPDNEGFTETVTTENGIPTRKEVIYPDKDAAAQKIKTETITYEKSPSAMFYPAGQKLTLAVYRDAKSNITKSIETTRTPDGGTLAVHKKPGGTETKRVETRSDKSTITTTPTSQGGTLVVNQNPDGTETERVETKIDKSTITTTPTSQGGTLAVYRDAKTNITKSIETTRTPEDGTLAVHKNPGGTETKRVETRSDKSTITTKTTAGVTTKELVIHPSVTAIEDKAFYFRSLTSVIIGNGVQTIGEKAFYGNQLTSVIIGNGVKTIGKQAFQKNKLISLTIGSSVQTIESEAFRDNKLYSVTIPSSVTSIESCAFNRNKLTSVKIGNGVKTIGDMAFSGYNGFYERGNQLTTLTIPPSVTVIGKAAFSNNRLFSVSIPASIDLIRKTAFAENRNLYMVNITGTGAVKTKAFTYLDIADSDWHGLTRGVFYQANSSEIWLTIEDGVTSIGDSAFAGINLISVVIGKNVRKIGSKAFMRNKLTRLTIPSSVTAIGERAFTLNRLTSLTILPSVTAIGGYAFSSNNLTSVILSKVLYETRGTEFNRNYTDLQFRDHEGRKLGTN